MNSRWSAAAAAAASKSAQSIPSMTTSNCIAAMHSGGTSAHRPFSTLRSQGPQGGGDSGGGGLGGGDGGWAVQNS